MGKPKLNIPMCAALVLLLLTMISIHLTSGLFARYTSSSSGADSARVAKFDVKVTGPAENVLCEVTALHPGGITFTVENKSEVAIEYSIRVKINEAAGCGVLVLLDSDEGKRLEFEAGKEAEKKYSNVGQLEIGSEATSHSLTFEPLDWTKITSGVEGAASELLEQAFTVYIDAVQID